MIDAYSLNSNYDIKSIYNKFTVIKNEDIDKYLNDKGKATLYHCLEVISDGRNIDGKKNNNYLVINKDESYVELIQNLILKKETYNEESNLTLICNKCGKVYDYIPSKCECGNIFINC